MLWHPPPLPLPFVPQITSTTEPFSGLTFLCFLGKNVRFLKIPYYIMFYENFWKSLFFILKSHFVSFFVQNISLVSLSFIFQILIKIQTDPFSWLTFLCLFGKNAKFFNFPYYMFYQNRSKSRFYYLESYFVSFFYQNIR